MSEKQWRRLDGVERFRAGKLTMSEAAQIMRLSTRQMRRVCRSVEVQGKMGVIHGNTGKSPPNRIDESIRGRVVVLFQTKYVGFNDQHFTEKLAKVEGISVSRSSVRRWLREAGIGAVRKRRPPRHRSRRDRKPQAGMMIQWDGSNHDWLEGRGPQLCLMGAVDDATSELLPGAHFVDQECTAGYLQALLSIAREKGLPWSIYMDQHGTLHRNDDYWTLEEELRGAQDPTHVGRAIEKLGVEMIRALSPQAKGRIERAWGTLQDRLVSELRLAGATTKEDANQVLEAFRPEYNALFAIPPADAEPVWGKVRRTLDLERICSFYYESTVLNDNTVRIGGRVIDVPEGPKRRGYAQAKVEVRQLLDGSWRVYYKDELIAQAESTEVGELRALKKRKRSAASRAFRKSVRQISVSLP